MNARAGLTLSPDELALLCRLLGCPGVAGTDRRDLGVQQAAAALSALAARGYLRWDGDDEAPYVVGAVAATVHLAAGGRVASTYQGETVVSGPVGAVVVSPGRFGTIRLEPLPAGTPVPETGPVVHEGLEAERSGVA